jgi:uncharacterized protein YqgC (DUF456 family)
MKPHLGGGGNGPLERLLAWLLFVVILAVLFEALVAMVEPLLPWMLLIGSCLIGLRLWSWHRDRW